jgi:four helix bundle protein
MLERGKGADIRARAFEFACSVGEMHRVIYGGHPYFRNCSSQALNAASSVGANLEEADAGQSRADFISKCNISLKEARESRYWLRLLQRLTHDTSTEHENLIHEATEIIAILTTIVRRSRTAKVPA